MSAMRCTGREKQLHQEQCCKAMPSCLELKLLSQLHGCMKRRQSCRPPQVLATIAMTSSSCPEAVQVLHYHAGGAHRFAVAACRTAAKLRAQQLRV